MPSIIPLHHTYHTLGLKIHWPEKLTLLELSITLFLDGMLISPFNVTPKHNVSMEIGRAPLTSIFLHSFFSFLPSFLPYIFNCTFLLALYIISSCTLFFQPVLHDLQFVFINCQNKFGKQQFYLFIGIWFVIKNC